MKIASSAWLEIQTILLNEASPSELMEFMKEITERGSYIYHYNGKKLENIFTPKIVKLLPKYNPKWEEKLSKII